METVDLKNIIERLWLRNFKFVLVDNTLTRNKQPAKYYKSD